jgi:hypothetical protein
VAQHHEGGGLSHIAKIIRIFIKARLARRQRLSFFHYYKQQRSPCIKPAAARNFVGFENV